MTAPTVMQQFCTVADFDAATQTCAAPFWGPSQGLLPNLTALDGFVISGVIVSCWAIGFLVRSMRRAGSA